MLLLFVFRTMTAQNKCDSISKFVVKDSLKVEFVVKKRVVTSQQFFFNVLRLENKTSRLLVLHPKLFIPDDWSLLSVVPDLVEIPAGKNFNIPIRISFSKNTLAGENRKLIVDVNTVDGVVLKRASSLISIPERRKWKIRLLNNSIFLPYGKNQSAPLSLRLSNTGNTIEKILLELESENINMDGMKYGLYKREIEMQPGFDSTYSFVMRRRRVKQTSSVSKAEIQIRASNKNNTFEDRAVFVSYKSEYLSFSRQDRPLHSIELRSANINGKGSKRDGFSARGLINLSRNRRVLYSLFNNDINGPARFYDNTYYDLRYVDSHWNAGIGYATSDLGRRFGSPKSAFASYRTSIDSVNSVESFVSRGIDDPISSVGAGYTLNNSRIRLKPSLSYNCDGVSKTNIASAKIIGDIKVTEKQRLNLYLQASILDNERAPASRNKEYSGFIGYDFRVGDKLRFNINSNLNKTNYFGIDRLYLGFMSNISYSLDQNKYFKLSYVNAHRDEELFMVDGGLMNSVVDLHQIKFELNHNSTNSISYSLGSLVDLRSEKEPLADNNILISTDRYSYNIYGSLSGKLRVISWYLSSLGGFQQSTGKDDGNQNDDNSSSKMPINIMLNGGLSNNSLGINVLYENGERLDSYAFNRSLDLNRVNISAYWRKDLLNKRLSSSVYGNYSHDINLKSQALTVTPSIIANFKNFWTLSVSSDISVNRYHYGNTDSKYQTTRFRVKLRKDYNLKKRKERTSTHDLNVVCFQDENRNGILDPNEKGIKNVMVRINRDFDEVQSSGAVFMNNIPLITDKKGKLSYHKIPGGWYRIEVESFANTEGYFNMKGENIRIKLSKDLICFVPFMKAYKIEGTLNLEKARFSEDSKVKSAENIRIIVTDSKKNEYYGLTDHMGDFNISVPGNDTYIIRVNNPFGRSVTVKNNNQKRVFDKEEVVRVNFSFVEKQRRIRFVNEGKQLLNSKLQVLSPNIMFEFGSSYLTKQAIMSLKRIAHKLSVLSGYRLEISAHTDFIGSRKYNYSLAKLRADRIVEYLKREGIDNIKIRKMVYGETKPIRVSKEMSLKYPFLKEGMILDENRINSFSSQKERDIAMNLNRRTRIVMIK